MRTLIALILLTAISAIAADKTMTQLGIVSTNGTVKITTNMIAGDPVVGYALIVHPDGSVNWGASFGDIVASSISTTGAINAATFNVGTLTVTNPPSLNLSSSYNFVRTNSINPIQTWVGPTNTLLCNNGIWEYVILTGSNTAVTAAINANGDGYFANALLRLTNSTGVTVTNFFTGIGNASGPLTTNAMLIPAGKVGFISINTWGGYATNYMTIVNQ